MPIYEYVCTACGDRSEVLHGISETGPTSCRVCGGSMRKALSLPAIVFKGSGWAKKDARSASRASTGTSGEGDAPAESAPGAPAATAEASDGGSQPAKAEASDGGPQPDKRPGTSPPERKRAAGSSVSGD